MRDGWGWEDAEEGTVTVTQPIRALDDDEDWEEKAWQDDSYDEPDELDGFEDEDDEGWDDDDDDGDLDDEDDD